MKQSLLSWSQSVNKINAKHTGQTVISRPLTNGSKWSHDSVDTTDTVVSLAQLRKGPRATNGGKDTQAADIRNKNIVTSPLCHILCGEREWRGSGGNSGLAVIYDSRALPLLLLKKLFLCVHCRKFRQEQAQGTRRLPAGEKSNWVLAAFVFVKVSAQVYLSVI